MVRLMLWMVCRWRLRQALLLVVCVMLALAGCMGPTFIVQQYRGDVRPPETIAVLRVNGSEPVRLLLLDNEDVSAPLESDSRLHIEMLPAKHSVIVGNAKAPAERYLPVSWQAEAGKVYRVMFVASAGPEGGVVPHVFEVDRAKDSSVRDVTLTAPASFEAPKTPPTMRPPPPSDEDAGPPPAISAPDRD